MRLCEASWIGNESGMYFLLCSWLFSLGCDLDNVDKVMGSGAAILNTGVTCCDRLLSHIAMQDGGAPAAMTRCKCCCRRWRCLMLGSQCLGVGIGANKRLAVYECSAKRVPRGIKLSSAQALYSVQTTSWEGNRITRVKSQCWRSCGSPECRYLPPVDFLFMLSSLEKRTP